RQPQTVRLWQLVRESDAVHVAGPAILPMTLSWLANKPFVVEHHGYQAICPNGLLLHQPEGQICPGHFQARHYGERLRCEKTGSGRSGVLSLVLTTVRNWLVRRARANIVVSHHVDGRVALPHSRVIYHGIDPPGPFAESATSGTLCFAYVGRFVPEKG